MAEKRNRIDLKRTYFAFAKYLEEMGDVHGAIAAYEKSGQQVKEITRMLLSRGTELEDYVHHSKDVEIKKWWAQYAECRGNVDVACQFYEVASDLAAVVRVLCDAGKRVDVC